MVLEPNLALGYRKAQDGAGSWLVKRNIVMPPDGNHARPWRRRPERPLGVADDHRDADGVQVLSFAQAQRRALDEAHQAALRTTGKLYTVRDAVADYIEFLRQNRKSADDTEIKFKAYVLPLLADTRVSELSHEDLDRWLRWALARRRKPKRSRDRAEPLLAQTPEQAQEQQRRRKSTINRVITALKACLNYAHTTKKVSSREAWAHLRKYRSADSARLRWLTVDEATRLQNACNPEFRRLVRAALLTGCRAGELRALRSSDFDPYSRTLLIADSKSGKPRRVPLTDEGVVLFEELTAGRATDAALFSRSDGSPWYRMAVVRAMKDACLGGEVRPSATFHTLRHTYASHLVQAGVPLLFVASALGHGDTRMVEKHYGHLAPSQVADMIRERLPTFGTYKPSNVRPLRRRKH
jgi:integrase